MSQGSVSVVSFVLNRETPAQSDCTGDLQLTQDVNTDLLIC